MNANLKNGLVTLAIFSTSAAVVGGIGYGVKKCLESEKPEITVTDPQKAEQDIQTESDYSRVFFEASQNMQSKEAEKVEEPPVADISALCREIAYYQQINKEIIEDLKAGKRYEVRFKIGSAERKENLIRKSFDELGYKKAATPTYIDKLGSDFENYTDTIKARIASLMK